MKIILLLSLSFLLVGCDVVLFEPKPKIENKTENLPIKTVETNKLQRYIVGFYFETTNSSGANSFGVGRTEIASSTLPNVNFFNICDKLIATNDPKKFLNKVIVLSATKISE